MSLAYSVTSRPDDPHHCNTCGITDPELTIPLYRCPKCRSVNYCSHGCELVDWMSHRGHCDQMFVSIIATRRNHIAVTPTDERSSTGLEINSSCSNVASATTNQNTISALLPEYLSSAETEFEDGGTTNPSSAISANENSNQNTEEPRDSRIAERDRYSSQWPSDTDSRGLGDILEALAVESAPSVAPPGDLIDLTDINLWLAELPDLDCYHAIIDVYRLRVEDNYARTGKIEAGSVYTKTCPMAHFMHFLELARQKRILPDSWSPKKIAACQQVALDGAGKACIWHAVDGGYLLDKHKDSDSTMVLEVLRLVADKVYGCVLFPSTLQYFEGPPGSRGWWG